MVVVDYMLRLMAIAAMVVPLLAVILCEHMEPRSLFRRLSASAMLRSWVMVLVIACSAFTGAFLWSMLYMKYHAPTGPVSAQSPEAQQAVP